VAAPPAALTIASRDLLALATTRTNLEQNGYAGPIVEYHTAGLAAGPADDGLELVIGTLNEGEGLAICRENLRRAAARFAGVPMLLGCSSSLGSRLVPREESRPSGPSANPAEGFRKPALPLGKREDRPWRQGRICGRNRIK